MCCSTVAISSIVLGMKVLDYLNLYTCSLGRLVCVKLCVLHIAKKDIFFKLVFLVPICRNYKLNRAMLSDFRQFLLVAAIPLHSTSR